MSDEANDRGTVGPVQSGWSLDPEEMLKAILDAATVAIFVKDADGRYLLVNRRLEELWDLPASQIIGRDDHELQPEEIAVQLRAHDRQVLASGQALTIEEQAEFGGRRQTYYSSKVPLLDPDGNPCMVCGIAVDISELKEAEAALRHSEARFRTMADSAPVLIWISDDRKNGVFFNQTWLDYTGRSSDQERGEGWLENVHPDDAEALQECEQAFSACQPFTTRFRLRRHDGEYRWMLDSGVPLHDPDGSFSGFIGSCTDITAMIRMEDRLKAQASELARNDARKNEFLAMLGHELRNPLAPLRSVIDLFQSRGASLGDELNNAVEVADRQLTHLRRIVDDLLDVGRISRGRISLNRVSLPIAPIINAAVEVVLGDIVDKGQELEVVTDDEEAWIDADEVRITQVLVNLLRNAHQFTPEGGRIRIRTALDEDRVHIAVDDTGIGIDPDLLPHVFDLFEQNERELARAEGGLGIGLTVARRLVEQHGGRIEAQSRGIGGGSTFSIWLPRAEAGVAAPAAPEQPPVPGPCRRVLVVDDNRDAADSLAAMLAMAGYEPAVVYDGEAALERTQAFEPDAVLLDIGLPGMDGYEVAEQLRNRGNDSLLVALTGYGQSQDRIDAQRAGFDHFLLKPAEFRTLKAVLDRVGHDSALHGPSASGRERSELR